MADYRMDSLSHQIGQHALWEEVGALQRDNARLRAALREIVAVLGPFSFGCLNCCNDCRAEGDMALRTAKESLR